MKRNCNLELRLFPSSSLMMEEPRVELQQQQEQQQLTIFYKGRVCACDVTELQARSILLLASRETEERLKTPTGSSSTSEPSSPSLKSPLYGPATGLSMKRSLQRFLQKRKNRVQATSPYHH